jgi:hypothetical protein
MKRALMAGLMLLLLVSVLTWQSRSWAEDKPPAKENKERLSPKDERNLLLQTSGLLAASQVYQAYLNVGFMADGKAAGTYDDKDLQQIMESVTNLLAATDQQLEKVAKLELSDADREGLEQIRKLSALVRQQAEELQAFWKTGEKEHGDKYEKLRQEAWQGISTLLKLEKR